jgi:hypothetical protein
MKACKLQVITIASRAIIKLTPVQQEYGINQKVRKLTIKPENPVGFRKPILIQKHDRFVLVYLVSGASIPWSNGARTSLAVRICRDHFEKTTAHCRTYTFFF